MDVLRNQIIERKVVDLILANAVFKEVPYQIEESDVAALELTAAGGERSEIPEAKPGGEPAEETRKHENALVLTGARRTIAKLVSEIPD